MLEIQLHKILNVEMCWDILREACWSGGVSCPNCHGKEVLKNGKDPDQVAKQHYTCKSCGKYFDNLIDTLFSGSQQPLHHWIMVLYMCLEPSNRCGVRDFGNYRPGDV